ncbi:hypothetical protein IE077_003302 [Cardiosporidium cionae]|uniref:RRM domain-containing protein n=1 Tax=Cardiosporidium cionae TaxID=476202 RepID=A0ABQ7J8L6_9APIC|nr:hypothetical protein IE077_003302 [Cardiosporidium cionae]|eukprot:KAF8820308.1 hypothetical protein IE077_003302 [Cardiosporidium cionae]
MEIPSAPSTSTESSQAERSRLIWNRPATLIGLHPPKGLSRVEICEIFAHFGPLRGVGLRFPEKRNDDRFFIDFQHLKHAHQAVRALNKRSHVKTERGYKFSLTLPAEIRLQIAAGEGDLEATALLVSGKKRMTVRAPEERRERFPPISQNVSTISAKTCDTLPTSRVQLDEGIPSTLSQSDSTAFPPMLLPEKTIAITPSIRSHAIKGNQAQESIKIAVNDRHISSKLNRVQLTGDVISTAPTATAVNASVPLPLMENAVVHTPLVNSASQNSTKVGKTYSSKIKMSVEDTFLGFMQNSNVFTEITTESSLNVLDSQYSHLTMDQKLLPSSVHEASNVLSFQSRKAFRSDLSKNTIPEKIQNPSLINPSVIPSEKEYNCKIQNNPARANASSVESKRKRKNSVTISQSRKKVLKNKNKDSTLTSKEIIDLLSGGARRVLTDQEMEVSTWKQEQAKTAVAQSIGGFKLMLDSDLCPIVVPVLPRLSFDGKIVIG